MKLRAAALLALVRVATGYGPPRAPAAASAARAFGRREWAFASAAAGVGLAAPPPRAALADDAAPAIDFFRALRAELDGPGMTRLERDVAAMNDDIVPFSKAYCVALKQIMEQARKKGGLEPDAKKEAKRLTNEMMEDLILINRGARVYNDRAIVADGLARFKRDTRAFLALDPSPPPPPAPAPAPPPSDAAAAEPAPAGEPAAT